MQLSDQIILATPPHDAARLLPDSKDLKRDLVKLAARWHPDTCTDPRAGEVFSHLLAMRDRVTGRKASTAGADTGLRFAMKDGRAFRLTPLSRTKIDQGEIILCANSIMTRYEPDYADLAEAEMGMPARFRFANDAMRDQMKPFLPKIERKVEIESGGVLVATRRGREEVLLSDIIEAEGAMPPVHAAWLCSGLMNIAAWLGYAGLVHGAIAPDVLLVDPARHSVRLAAGWGFATTQRARPSALPGRTLDLMPRLALKGEVVESGTDLELVRQTVREALGDPRGSAGPVAALPDPIRSWLSTPPAGGAAEDYAAWQRALEAAWGKRRFVDYPIRSKDLYAKAA